MIIYFITIIQDNKINILHIAKVFSPNLLTLILSQIFSQSQIIATFLVNNVNVNK